jgi:hypothetical protein
MRQNVMEAKENKHVWSAQFLINRLIDFDETLHAGSTYYVHLHEVI